MKKLRAWLVRQLSCKHKHFEYEFSGGKACSFNDSGCDCQMCSIPVYEIYCRDCGKRWTVGIDEVIDIFATRRKEQNG